MTGFAREEGACGPWTWAVEARSVNGRNLEVRFRGPPGFDGLERAARDGAQARFQRGQLTVGLQARRAEAAGAVRVNLEQLERYLELGRGLVDAGRCAPPSLDGLLALRGVIEAADDTDTAELRAEVEAAMAASIGRALDGLKAARLEEGAALAPVLGGLVGRVLTLVEGAEAEAKDIPALLKARLIRKMADLVAERTDLDERIVVEASLLASKADVREELDRLASHVQAAQALLSGDGPVAGRRLDFLTQEFMREANTLCSKSVTTALTAVGLELKATIEQFREQVQNVE